MKILDLKRTPIYALLALSVLGVTTIFLPWIEYPILELTMHGKDGDGWLISLTFFIVGVLCIYTLFSKNEYFKLIPRSLVILLNLVILCLSIYKIYAFNLEVANYTTDSPIMGYAASGAHLSYGLYAITFISSLQLILAIFEKTFRSYKNIALLLISLVLLAIIGMSATKIISRIGAPDDSSKVLNLKNEFSNMSTALIEQKPDDFVNYIHPILYESVGGKKQLAKFMAGMYENVRINNSKIIDLKTLVKKGSNIQTLITQESSYTINNIASSSQSTSFAFSYDQGRTWVFAGTEERSFDEMKKILPEIFDELRY